MIEISNLIREATSNLSNDENVYLLEENGSSIELPKKINIQVSEKDINSKECIIENESEQILKIKKPDYIADSAWEFKIGRKVIKTKIEDTNWINQFLNKEIKEGNEKAERIKKMFMSQKSIFSPDTLALYPQTE